jgi:hypothetical protein
LVVGERSYELLPSLLATEQNFTYGAKYIIETPPSTKFGVKKFYRVAWAFGLCISVWPYLWLVLTIDAGLYQERWAQHLDEGLNRWGIMTSNGSESLNNVFMIIRQLPVCAIVKNTLYKGMFGCIVGMGMGVGFELILL